MSVQIICHRGWWGTPADQNTFAAFVRAAAAGCGVELDVRDWEGELVVAHDPYLSHQGRQTWFRDVATLAAARPDLPLLVNVKACGLAPLFCRERPPASAVFFDMAPADLPAYSRRRLPYLCRVAPHEPAAPAVARDAAGWWVDGMGDPDYFPELPGRVFVASPDLHGVDPLPLWRKIRDGGGAVALCTDRPAEAAEFFA